MQLTKSSTAHESINSHNLDNIEEVLGSYVFDTGNTTTSAAGKVCWAALNVILASGSYAICYPVAKASFQSSAKLGAMYAAGAFLNWGTFTFFGMAEWASIVFSKLSDEEKMLFRARLNTTVRTILATAGFIGGVGSRLPGAAVGLIFTHTWFWTLLPLVFEAGVPAYSLTKKLEGGVEGLLDRWQGNKATKDLEKVKILVIARINFSLRYGLKRDVATRASHFKNLYLQDAVAHLAYGKKIQEVMREIKDFYEQIASKEQSKPASNFVICPRTSLQVIFSLLSMGLLVQNSALAQIAVESWSENTWAEIGGMCLAVLPMCWIVLMLPGATSKHLFDLIMDCIGIARNNKTFSEEFFPKTIKLITSIELFFAWMIYGGISQIAKNSMNYEKEIGKQGAEAILDVIIASNFITLFLMIVHSYMHYTDKFIQIYTRNWGANEDLKNAIAFKDLLERLREAFEKMKPVNFALFLEHLEDPEVKQYFLGDRMTSESLKNFIVLNRTEKTPLL